MPHAVDFLAPAAAQRPAGVRGGLLQLLAQPTTATWCCTAKPGPAGPTATRTGPSTPPSRPSPTWCGASTGTSARTSAATIRASTGRCPPAATPGSSPCPRPAPCPPDLRACLAGIPFIRQMWIDPPMILDPPSNTRTGSFGDVDRNPLDGLELSPDEWLCYPAQVGPLVIFIYFHLQFVGLGCALANLFDMATDRQIAAGPDALFVYGAPPEALAEASATLPTVFHEAPHGPPGGRRARRAPVRLFRLPQEDGPDPAQHRHARPGPPALPRRHGAHPAAQRPAPPRS